MNIPRTAGRSVFWAAILFGLTVCAGFADAAGTAAPSDLDPALFSKDFFPILAWDPLRGWASDQELSPNGPDSMAACNYTICGFALPRDLPRCEELGVKVIVMADQPDLHRWTKAWKTLSDEEIDRRVRELVAAAGDSPAVLGYFLMDEPGAASFPALGKAVAAVRKYAPGKLAYINLFPGYATLGAADQSQLQAASFTEYLERYVAEVKPQVISYDNYFVQRSQDMQDAKSAVIYYRDLMEVRRVALAHGLPFWNIVSSNQIRPFTTIPSPANLRFQAYTTLAAGGRGVTWYTYYARNYGYAPIDDNREKTLTWNYLQSVNHEIKTLGPLMNRLTSTGVYFTQPAPVPGLPPMPGRLVDTIETSSTTPLMVGEFEDEQGAPYVMVVNLSMERSVRLTPKKSGETLHGVYFSAQDAKPRRIDDEAGLWLVAGQGVLLKFD